MRRIKVPIPSTRALAIGAWLAALATVGIILWMLVLIGELSASSEQSKAELSALAQTNAEQDAALERINRQRVAQGKEPIEVPELPDVPPGLSAAAVAGIAREVISANPGLTAAQVERVVQEFFASNPAPRGPRGATGPAPGRALVRAVVREVYATNPPPAGEDGADAPCLDTPEGCKGAPGDDGRDGIGVQDVRINEAGRLIVTLTDGRTLDAGNAVGPKGEKGDQGPGPSSEQVAAGVADWCTPRGDCIGPAGPAGQSAFPFTFAFTVQQNPAQSTTYTVTCTADGCAVSQSP